MRHVSEAIAYQLHERLQFVRPPDPVVHDLLFDLGNLEAIRDIVENAVPIYRFALQFGSVRKPIIDTRVNHFQSLMRWNFRKFADEHFGIVMLMVVGIMVILCSMYVRSRRKGVA